MTEAACKTLASTTDPNAVANALHSAETDRWQKSNSRDMSSKHPMNEVEDASSRGCTHAMTTFAGVEISRSVSSKRCCVMTISAKAETVTRRPLRMVDEV